MLLSGLDRAYDGVSIDTTQPIDDQLSSLNDDNSYVVKVDQAIKKRMKQGLVKLNRSKAELHDDIREFANKGYRYCLVEPMLPHEQADECYLSFEYSRDGVQILYSRSGGIEIESAADSVTMVAADAAGIDTVATALSIPTEFVRSLVDIFNEAYACSIEINPLIGGPTPQLLDVAAVVDGEAAHLAREYWTAEDYRSYRQQTAEEVAVDELAATSRSSLRYEVINPDGAVWLLLSGGGASVTIADEVNNRGYGQQLGNYGEYSGNPTEPETFAYTEQLLRSLLQSNAPRKVLIIAGGVANFTDIRTTFAGVIRAIDAHAEALAQQGIKVYVRRGGPHEVEGLAIMRDFLATHDLLGAVNGPELTLAESVTAGLASLAIEGETDV